MAGAKRCVLEWKKAGKKLVKSVKVSEVGFGYESPAHEHDEIFCVEVLTS
jgi:hypothetical protein